MNESQSQAGSQEPRSRRERVDKLCDEFERDFRAGRQPRIEDFLDRAAAADREHLVRELLAIELELRRAAGLPYDADDYRQRFAAQQAIVEPLVETAAAAATGDSNTPVMGQPPASGLAGMPPTSHVIAEMPQAIGRFSIVKVLGQGGFAVVYLARDTELDRLVALKVPRLDRLGGADALRIFVEEARKAAQLDHPGIVRVYDVQREASPVYIVQEFIDGQDLAAFAKQRPPTPRQSAELLVAVAAAVGHAHRLGFVHRDLKPANILVDSGGKPRVADFGLSLHESAQRRHVGEWAGSFPYVSPEQMRRETHRLDGRSDLWSLGVILYELLAGRRPFDGTTLGELQDEILHRDPKPPRMVAPNVPRELSRICLACLAKRATDRYASAADLIDDLQHWLDGKSAAPAPAKADNHARATPAAKPPTKILPKGLRSYDAADADFFLQLLPGPHDREGLPKGVRFWKTQLEQCDPDETFKVGLMYGPSGCGKSSLVKAALIPRLSADVLPIYIEATAADTEVRLIKALKKHCPELAPNASLPEQIVQLRSTGGSRGRKVVLVLDQFEQWLHAHETRDDSQLIPALRQCDGGTVQCLALVRDDFWMSATRFMQALEVPLVEGHNSAAVFLFDPDHARKVLTILGQAYGKLPEPPAEPSGEQQDFLAQAVTHVADAGKVVCVRLAVFAEMMKGRPWTAAGLREVGGMAGVGVAFLDETFSGATAPMAHRTHQAAVRAVLKALLPEQGAEIKGQMRSHDQLLEAAGYRGRGQDFDALLNILDGEARLITPTDPDETDADKGSLPAAGRGRYYQLTHDYLVPSLRDWLTRKQRETRRGRAELRLEERAATWNARPENRYLPSLWEYLTMRALTDARHWTAGQRTMMSRATRVHGVRSALSAVALAALFGIGMAVRANVARQQEAIRVAGLVDSLVIAEPNQLPDIVKELDANPEVAATYLSPLLARQAETTDARRAQLHARLATVARDPSLVEPLVEELLTGKVTYVLPIRQLLRPSSSKLADRFRSLLKDEKADPQRRFRAALALADYVPASESAMWTEQGLKFVAERLVAENAEFQPLWRDLLRPIGQRLLEDLERVFGDARATDAQRLGAANALADYSASDLDRLSRLLAVATPEQFARLYPLVEANRSSATIENLGQIVATLPPDELGWSERIAFGQRRANAAATLLRLGEREKALPVFSWTDDPEALTQFIFRCRPREVGVQPLLDCLHRVSSSPRDRYPRDTRYALLLGLGEFTRSEIPVERFDAIVAQLADWHRNDPSSGVHGAVGWLLRQWGQAQIALQVDQTPAPYAPEREWFTLAIEVAAKSDSLGSLLNPTTKKKFYYTFIVFPAGEYAIGSVANAADRERDELPHQVILSRPFALLDREITMEELIAFRPWHKGFVQQDEARQPSEAGFAADWYDAVGFCRWLGEQMVLPEADQAYAAPESLDPAQYPREPQPEANWAPRDWPVDLERRGFRLPTESEWEIGARGGARTAYSYGSDAGLLGRFGWFAENSGKHAHPPRELGPSVRGLFDLHGNVFEWTHDWAGDYRSAAAKNPVGPTDGSLRVFRGGCWGSVAANCRSAYRNAYVPTDRSDDRGFRLALSPSGVSPEAGPVKGAEPAGGGTEGPSAEQRPELP